METNSPDTLKTLSEWRSYFSAGVPTSILSVPLSKELLANITREGARKLLSEETIRNVTVEPLAFCPLERIFSQLSANDVPPRKKGQ